MKKLLWQQRGIERAEADSVITEKGTIMTKVTYLVKNTQGQFLRIRLPEDSKLLSAFLNGKEVQPASDKEYLLIPIEKSSQTAFPIEIAFLSRREPFRIMGSYGVLLPENDIPVEELFWRLYTPVNYQILRFSGNMEQTGKRLFAANFQNQAYGYENWESEASNQNIQQNYQYNAKGLKERFKRQNQKISEQLAQIQVQIPVFGNQYRFESYIVKQFTPEIRFFYINEKLHNIAAFISFLIFFLFSLWTLGLIFEKEILPENLLSIKNYIKGAGIIILFILLFLIFSFGIFEYFCNSITFAIALFALWQNRYIDHKYQEFMKRTETFSNIIILIILLFMTGFLLISGEWFLPGFFSFIVILIQHFTLKKKQILKNVSVILFLTAAIFSGYFSTAAWAESALPDLKDTQVTLSLETVEDLLKKIEQKAEDEEKKPETDYIFGTVQINGEISQKAANLKITIPIYVLSEDYVKIPLFSADAAVTEALLNNIPLALNTENGKIYFEIRKERNELSILKLNIVAPVQEKGGVHAFHLASPLIQGGLIELSFGEEIQSVNLEGVSWQEREGQKIKAALGKSQELRGELATFLREKDTADETSKRVKKIYSTTYTLVSLEDKIATFYSSVRYQILNDLVAEFMIRLPDDVAVHEIVGDDLEKWEIQGTENGLTTYIIKPLYPVAERYDLSVQYEKAIQNEKEGFAIPNLEVIGAARDVGYLGIELQTQAEIFLKKIAKARVIDIQELPEIIKADAYSPFVYAMRYVEHPYEIVFEIQKHKNLRTDPAIADRIQYSCVISPKGKVLYQAQMWIRNSQKQFAAFMLPENANLVSVFLDDKSVKPSMRKNRELLLPLKRQSAEPFILEVLYEDADVSLTSFGGHIKIDYPEIDIPVSVAAVDIYVPRDMYFFRAVGDFRETESVSFLSWRNESQQKPVVTGVYDYMTKDQVREEISQSQQITRQSSNIGGTLPLKITLPKKGKKISLDTFYVPAGASLNTEFFLIHKIFRYIGYGLAILLFTVTGFFIPSYPRLSRILRLTGIAGFLLLFFLIPIAWREIIFYLLAGVAVRYIWIKIYRKSL